MVIITQYKCCRKSNGIIQILKLEMNDSICPVCGGKLTVHGTCSRKALVNDDDTGTNQVEFHLRVLKCRTCGKTHRELPDILVPYKRYSLPLICREIEDENYDCDTSTMLRLKWWVDWFISYAKSVIESLAIDGVKIRTTFAGENLCTQLTYFVRAVANSGFWPQHRSAMTGFT